MLESVHSGASCGDLWSLQTPMSMAALTLAVAGPPRHSAGAFTKSHPRQQLYLHQILYSGIQTSPSACSMQLRGPPMVTLGVSSAQEPFTRREL